MSEFCFGQEGPGVVGHVVRPADPGGFKDGNFNMFN